VRAHGERARYVHGPDEQDRPKSETGKGCRCDDCCEANRAYALYQQKRRRIVLAGGKRDSGPWADPFIDATEVREHLLALQGMGVGRRTIAERTGLSESNLVKLRRGETKRCKRETANLIFSVFPKDAKPRAYVPAARTWRLIDDMVANGHTKASIAKAIGKKGRALQLSRSQVTGANARAIEELYERVMVRVLRDREIAADRQRKCREQVA
jgi:hypothetical protein